MMGKILMGTYKIYDGHLQIYDGHLQIYDGHLQTYDGHLQIYDGHLQIYDGHLQIYDGHLQIYDGHLQDASNAQICAGYIYATMRKYLEKNIMPSTSIFQSSIFGAPTRLEPTTHRVVRRYWSSAPHADLRMVRSHIGHYNQWAA
jgi:hypothetical protein